MDILNFHNVFLGIQKYRLQEVLTFRFCQPYSMCFLRNELIFKLHKNFDRLILSFNALFTILYSCFVIWCYLTIICYMIQINLIVTCN